MTDKNGKKQSDHSIEYAYITFKSMSGRKMAMKIYILEIGTIELYSSVERSRMVSK